MQADSGTIKIRLISARRRGICGIHHIPPGAKVLMPASIERSVWEYFSGKAEQRGVELSELLTEVLKRDIEIDEALK